MPYVPINQRVFLAAYTGAMGGVAIGGGWIINDQPANYTNVCIIAGFYAEAVDQAWNNPLPISDIEYDKIQCSSEQLFVHRGAQPDLLATFQSQANWDLVAKALVALVDQADIYLGTQGIIPVNNSAQRVRGVVTDELPLDLTQFDVTNFAGNDGIGYVAGDYLLAIGESTRRGRSGPWLITTVVAGKGTLIRPPWWPHGATLQTSGIPIEVGAEGQFYSNTRFRAMGPQAGGSVLMGGNTFVVDTDDPGMYPEVQTSIETLVEGSIDIDAPILSLGTGVAVTDTNVRPNTTLFYQVTLQAGDLASGGGLTIEAITAGGIPDAANSGNILVTITNQFLGARAPS